MFTCFCIAFVGFKFKGGWKLLLGVALMAWVYGKLSMWFRGEHDRTENDENE